MIFTKFYYCFETEPLPVPDLDSNTRYYQAPISKLPYLILNHFGSNTINPLDLENGIAGYKILIPRLRS